MAGMCAYPSARRGRNRDARHVGVVLDRVRDPECLAVPSTLSVGSALLAGGRIVLPLGKNTKAANKPDGRPTHPIELEWPEPGVKMGQ